MRDARVYILCTTLVYVVQKGGWRCQFDVAHDPVNPKSVSLESTTISGRLPHSQPVL